MTNAQIRKALKELKKIANSSNYNTSTFTRAVRDRFNNYILSDSTADKIQECLFGASYAQDEALKELNYWLNQY